MAAKKNYLNNKDLLAEIHKSKNSFSEFIDPSYEDYDLVLMSVDEFDDEESIILAKKNRADRFAQKAFQKAKLEEIKELSKLPKSKQKGTVKLAQFKIDPNTISENDLVFRIYTYEHIPESPKRKKNPKTEQDKHVKLNFIPFKHYVISDDKELLTYNILKGIDLPLMEVGRSHSFGGGFSDSHGSITDKLAKMFIMLVDRYSQRPNWRGYTYIDEMKGQALLQLSAMGLKFNEAKSDNPFAYFSTCIEHSFTRIVSAEKRNQNIRDDLLEIAGQSPSFTRQFEIEQEIRKMRDSVSEDEF